MDVTVNEPNASWEAQISGHDTRLEFHIKKGLTWTIAALEMMHEHCSPWEPNPPMPFSSTVIMIGCSLAICLSSRMSKGLQKLHITLTASAPP